MRSIAKLLRGNVKPLARDWGSYLEISGICLLGCGICVLPGNGNALELDQETGAWIYFSPDITTLVCATATLLSQLNVIGFPRFLVFLLSLGWFRFCWGRRSNFLRRSLVGIMKGGVVCYPSSSSDYLKLSLVVSMPRSL